MYDNAHIHVFVIYFSGFMTLKFEDLAWDESRGEKVLRFKVKATRGREPLMSSSFQPLYSPT